MKNIALLGSTGSIGRQTVEVALANPQELKIRVLAAHKNVDVIERQARLLQPDLVVLADKAAAYQLERRLGGSVEVLAGEEGLLAAATYQGIDTVLAAIVGYSGLRPTLAAIQQGKDIALANKETLVAAGHLVMAAVAEHGVRLTPVDSEHSAIFQALQAGAKGEVRRLLLTASGGPFRGYSREQLAQVTLEQCLRHPTWQMGPKVTIDSSTLANKGLEVVEAHWLFGLPYEQISVVIQPQSIVHSLVEYVDGSLIAQLGMPDMRLPIQYALSYPRRFPASYSLLDLVQHSPLTFEEPDLEAFPSLRIALDCAAAGGNLPCGFNAANEEAVGAFLAGRIRYLDIPALTEQVCRHLTPLAQPDLAGIQATDREARELARAYVGSLPRP